MRACCRTHTILQGRFDLIVEPSDDPALPYIRMVLAANDREHLLWPPENMQFAEETFKRRGGLVPTVEEIIDALGEERFRALCKTAVEKRKFDNACLGYQSPCHYCGDSVDLSKFDFGLMRVSDTSRDFRGAAASLVLSAALLATIGLSAIKLPGKSERGAAVHLRLIVCLTCKAREGGLFGSFLLTAKKAATHPVWKPLVSADFTRFLVRDTLPLEFKTMSHMRL